MTRLTEDDIRWLPGGVKGLDEWLRRATGMSLRGVAAHACGIEEPVAAELLTGTHVAAVPISAGQGFITGFSQTVAAICRQVGCEAFVTAAPDVTGLAEAVGRGARVVFAADEDTFIALNVGSGRCADNGAATGAAFVAALDGAARTLGGLAGGLDGQLMLVIGVGPVGQAAAARALPLGASALAADSDPDRLAAAARAVPVEPVSLEEGLRRARLIVDATPVAGIIGVEHLRPDTIVAAPGMPLGMTTEAARALGERLVHEPLALGVATMALQALL
jgi:pyrrolysine biosynthesis protein PylD